MKIVFRVEPRMVQWYLKNYSFVFWDAYPQYYPRLEITQVRT